MTSLKDPSPSSVCDDFLHPDLQQFHDDGMKLAKIFQPDLFDVNNIESLVNRMTDKADSYEAVVVCL